jgi:hypothetical protein
MMLISSTPLARFSGQKPNNDHLKVRVEKPQLETPEVSTPPTSAKGKPSLMARIALGTSLLLSSATSVSSYQLSQDRDSLELKVEDLESRLGDAECRLQDVQMTERTLREAIRELAQESKTQPVALPGEASVLMTKRVMLDYGVVKQNETGPQYYRAMELKSGQRYLLELTTDQASQLFGAGEFFEVFGQVKPAAQVAAFPEDAATPHFKVITLKGI